jgi:hypothetical protein
MKKKRPTKKEKASAKGVGLTDAQLDKVAGGVAAQLRRAPATPEAGIK